MSGIFFFFSSRRRHTRCSRDWSSDVCSSDLQNRPHLMELIKVFRARVVDVAPESLIIEVSGTVDKIDGLLEVLRPFGVLEMARTDRKSTRLNSSHGYISYAVFCLKKKNLSSSILSWHTLP